MNETILLTTSGRSVSKNAEQHYCKTLATDNTTASEMSAMVENDRASA